MSKQIKDFIQNIKEGKLNPAKDSLKSAITNKLKEKIKKASKEINV